VVFTLRRTQVIHTRRDICRITAIMKVEIDIITSIETSLIARAVILVIVFVDIFTTDAIVFIGYVIMH
jgi:hypothetical protein